MYAMQQIVFYVSAIILGYTVVVDPLAVATSFVWSWVLGVTVVSAYYHRYLAHRGWSCPKPLETLMLILGAGHCLMPAIGWVNVHLQHHRFADTEKDPHGPTRSLLHNFNIAMNEFQMRYVTRSITNNKLVLLQANYYWLIMIIYFATWSYMFGAVSWFVVNGIVYLSLVSVNMLGHWRLKPRNIPVLALILTSEMYHKNHHNNASNPRFGALDPSWWFILLVQRFQKI